MEDGRRVSQKDGVGIMAMKKAEMEWHYAQYTLSMKRVWGFISGKQYLHASQAALEAWEHVDGMMKYARKYEDKEFSSVDAIDVVLRYAPLMFDYESLDRLEELLKEKRAIERNTDEDLGVKLEEARALMQDAHSLWNHIERNGTCRQDYFRRELGGDQERWRAISEKWEEIGLLERSPVAGSYEVKFVTRLGAIINGKCPNCGSLHKAPFGMFLERQKCVNCNTEDIFVIVNLANSK